MSAISEMKSERSSRCARLSASISAPALSSAGALSGASPFPLMAGDTVRLQLKCFALSGKHPHEKPAMTTVWRLSPIKKRKDWVLLLIKAHFPNLLLFHRHSAASVNPL